MFPKKCLTYLVDLCFERRCPKQNTVARLSLTIFPSKKFWAVYVTDHSRILNKACYDASIADCPTKNSGVRDFKEPDIRVA